ncbi:unnamed protein product [Larinioides sclopetarius]|uniref:SEC14-like protein 2 n=1 Tax=Larinioides sclopetarius TaxID=280406 RepID=A0AAV1YX03_9ARAC
MSPIQNNDTEETALIEELKRRNINDITPKMREDDTLWHRFLKARDFNLKDAEDMLKKHIQFRKEYRIDHILDEWEPGEVLAKYCTMKNIGYDKEGRPLIYIDMAADSKGLTSSVKRADFIRFGCWTVENSIEMMKKKSKELGQNVYQVVFIGNFDGMTFAQATSKKALELMLLAVTVFQDNYPERIKAVHVINGSIYFSLVWSVVKQFLAPAFQNKFIVYGTDKWRDALLKVIDPSELPAFIGGDRTDPDGNPRCNTFVIHARTVPESFYMKKSERKLHLSPGVKKLIVTRFAKVELTFDIEIPNSYLEWEFETKSKDIGFGVYFKAQSENKSKTIELVPKQRIDTCFEPETGVYRCEKPGTYIILFDNSYSWLYPKEIYYKTKINLPGEDGSEAIEPLA